MPFDQMGLDFKQGRHGADHGDIGMHKLAYGLVLEPVEEGLFKNLAGNESHQRALFDHGHRVDVVAHHGKFGIADMNIRLGIDGRTGHEVLGGRVGMDIAAKQVEQFRFGLDQGEVLDTGRSGGCMSAAPEIGCQAPTFTSGMRLRATR